MESVRTTPGTVFVNGIQGAVPLLSCASVLTLAHLTFSGVANLSVGCLAGRVNSGCLARDSLQSAYRQEQRLRIDFIPIVSRRRFRVQGRYLEFDGRPLARSVVAATLP